MVRALDLTDTTPFPSFTFGELDTMREGFTFNPDWETDLNFDMDTFTLSDSVLSKSAIGYDYDLFNKLSGIGSGGGYKNPQQDEYLASLKEKAGKGMFYGAAMKTGAAAMKLFAQLSTFGTNINNANRQAQVTKQNAANQIAALDNQVLYYKNQIADKFNQTIAKNTVTMAAKNLRVSAGSLLEQMKDEAYDATKDIQTLESNAELKRIALRSEQKQADITKKLQKSLEVANLAYSLGQVGLMVSTGGGTMQSWGDLYANAFGNGGQQ